jgi:hypothetical protein
VAVTSQMRRSVYTPRLVPAGWRKCSVRGVTLIVRGLSFMVFLNFVDGKGTHNISKNKKSFAFYVLFRTFVANIYI